MKIKILVITVLILLVGAVSTFWYIDYKTTEGAYVQAIEHIKTGDYDLAVKQLDVANKEECDKEDFYYDVNYNKSPTSYYKDSAYLYAYSFAMSEYNMSKSMNYIDRYLELIPDNYTKTLSDEINAFKEMFDKEYEEYLLEQARKREIEEDKKIRSSVPFVGMSESRINDTILGTNYEIVHNSEYIKGKRIRANVYRFKKGNAIIFTARCLNGRVDSVSDFRDDPWVISSRNASSYKKKSDDDDPYNVNDYSNAEDFYYDNYDDFWEYEEAEDYFDEHHE